MKIRKNDTVVIRAGKDRGKSAKVLKVLPRNNRAVVEGVNLVKKHMRRRSEQETGGIKEIPTTVNISNLGLVCSNCGKGVRFGVKVAKDKSKVRVCKRCQQVI